MSKLTEKERFGFEQILSEDLKAINQKLIEQIRILWSKARTDVIKLKGWDKLIEEKIKLSQEKNKITTRINQIENTLNSTELTPEQVVELGGKPNEFGRFSGANFFGIPITSQFEYDVMDYIRKHIDLEIPAKIIHDVCEASIRELTMSGTFEEAREAYSKFYSLDFRKYGVDIPPRLAEIKDATKLLDKAHNTLALGNNKDDLYLEYNEAKTKTRY